MHTDTVYISTFQRYSFCTCVLSLTNVLGVTSPETIVILRSISHIESLYLSRSSNKLNEVVGQAFSGGIRALPGSSEGVNVARMVSNELDAARFDPLLVKAIAKVASSSVNMMLSRAESLVSLYIF